MKNTSILKTPKDITKLNFNDMAFLKGITPTDAKWLLKPILEHKGKIKLNFDKRGNPIIPKDEYVQKSEVETVIKSSTNLEGKNYIDTIITHYNNGTTPHKLKQLSDVFYKKMKFTGKYTILNDILNIEQLLLLQKNSVLRNTFYAEIFNNETTEFIIDNDWVKVYLSENGVDIDKIEKNIKLYLIK